MPAGQIKVGENFFPADPATLISLALGLEFRWWNRLPMRHLIILGLLLNQDLFNTTGRFFLCVTKKKKMQSSPGCTASSTVPILR